MGWRQGERGRSELAVRGPAPGAGRLTARPPRSPPVQSKKATALFRRTKPDTSERTSASTEAPGKKGRPTPTRKEAEAAARARAKVPRTRKEMAAVQKSTRSESSAHMRQAMRTGDERYLPARDKGPVRRFVRDYVDSHFSFIEMLIPLMLVVLVLGYTGNPTITTYANLAMLSVFVLIVVDLVRLRFKLRRELANRFPDTSTHGATSYAVKRALSMRFMRLPKAQVKVGQRLPETYR
jgi:hypothetical protein